MIKSLLELNVQDHVEKKNVISQQELQDLLTYESETGQFYWKNSRNPRVKNGSVAGSIDSSGHLQIKINKRCQLAHRLVWIYVYGVNPPSQIDHINGNKLDNRITNLREANSKLNAENRRAAPVNNKTSGLLGVTWHKASKSWTAAIKTNGKRKHLGCFKTPEEAHLVYVNNKRLLHAGCSI
jgi:hypothetical protein